MTIQLTRSRLIGLLIVIVLLAGFASRFAAGRMPIAARPIVGLFTDTAGHWAEPYIEEIRLAGLTSGCSTDPAMFCPDAPLTRAEAAVLLARLLNR